MHIETHWSLYSCCTTIASALSFFLPIILRENMNMAIAQAQCLSTPPYFVAAAFMYAVAWAGDKYSIRSVWVIANGVLALIGLPMMGFGKSVAVR